jgi:hypothetical protein
MEVKTIPEQFEHLVSKTVKNYLDAPEDVQNLVRISERIRGRYEKYVFQLSHGTQQMKHYEPHKYKNSRNTPLRTRVRLIMKISKSAPGLDAQKNLLHLYRNYPYCLLKSEPVNLRMKNFYFEDKNVRENDIIAVYRVSKFNNPNRNNDEVYAIRGYSMKKTIRFKYEGRGEEMYYAVNESIGSISNVLHFQWKDEIPQIISQKSRTFVEQ